MKTCPTCGRNNPVDFSWCPECGNSLKTRKASPAELLERVTDRASFVEFVTALAEERAEAEALEKAEPIRYQFEGALNWQNGSISSFLYASMAYFEAKPFQESDGVPSWRLFAEILYLGKIYE